MARRAKYDKEQVVADWKTGNYSLRSLANKHRISATTAYNLTQGMDKSLEPLINAEVAIKQELANLNEQELNTFEKEVNKRTEHLVFFANAAVTNVQQAMKADCETQQDYKLRSETILKGREATVGKDPQVAVQNNLTLSLADALRGAGRCNNL